MDYPQPMIDLKRAGENNSRAMKRIREAVLQSNQKAQSGELVLPAHCRPSNEEEICKFFWLHDESNTNQTTIEVN